MKIQSLAVIFVIIILPISLVLSSYTKAKIETIDMQAQYDAKLNDATHDALKAYQVNAFSSDTSDFVNSKIRDIEGSVNTFYNSLASNFSSLGFTKNTLQNYVPALVYTMYDGYYIYSPYRNTWSTDTGIDSIDREMKEQIGLDPNDSTTPANEQTQPGTRTYHNTQLLFGVKPYIYYSCRYTKDDIDVVITYSLDNYIQIQGKIGSGSSVRTISRYGYLLDIEDLDVTNPTISGEIDVNNEDQVNNTIVTYKEINIGSEKPLKENVYVNGWTEPKNLSYIKKNGAKYYLDEDGTVFTILNGSYVSQDSIADQIKRGTLREDVYVNNKGWTHSKNLPYIERDTTKYYLDDDGTVFTILSGSYVPQDSIANQIRREINNNNNAKKYYIEAYNFRKFINENGLNELTTNDADESNLYTSLNGRIFDDTDIEAKDSNFNTHRMDVIKNSIKRNLSIAISNFNSYSGASTSTDFRMPELKETDWDKIMDNISIISFFQGANIGGKIYNGYSIITNTKNEDVVMDDSIYIKTGDGVIRHIAEEGIENNLNSAVGIFNINTEIRSSALNTPPYYIPVEGTLSYNSIVTKNRINQYNEYLSMYVNHLPDNTNNRKLKELYYTALARERYSLYRQRLEI